nr:DUF6292 family protein [Prauserella isguenensis]
MSHEIVIGSGRGNAENGNSGNIGSARSGPGHAEPRHVTSVRAEPGRTGSGHTEPGHGGALHEKLRGHDRTGSGKTGNENAPTYETAVNHGTVQRGTAGSTDARVEYRTSGYGGEEPVGQHVRVRRVRHGRGVQICEIEGELDLLTAPIVRRELDSAAEQGRHRLVVDMSGVEFCSVAGVELLLRAARRAGNRGGGLAVVAGRQVRRVVQLVAPEGPVAWCDSVCDAVHHVAGDRNVAAGGLADVDLDSTQRGLRRYVELVAAGLGLEAAAAWSDVDDITATAYVALDRELPGMEGREAALVWDGRTGWALGAETHSGEDLVMRAWYGTELLPEPAAVVRFVKALTAGDRVGLPGPPEPSGHPHAAQIVRARLQAAAWSTREAHVPEVDVPVQSTTTPPGTTPHGTTPQDAVTPRNAAVPRQGRATPLRGEGVG